MSEFRFTICALILVVLNFKNSEGYPSYASARQIYSTNSSFRSNNSGANNCGANFSRENNSRDNNTRENNFDTNNSIVNNSRTNNSGTHNSSNPDYQSLVFKSAFDSTQCLTIDNEISQIIIDRCVPLHPGVFPIWRSTPWKLEVARVKGTHLVQISQGFRPENQPFGLAGCLIPENGRVYASGHSCNYNVAYWGMRRSGGHANRHQLVHISSGKCLTFPESGNGVTTSNCNVNNVKQLWDVTEENQ